MYFRLAVKTCDHAPLVERKQLLREIVRDQPSVPLYANHVERTGIEFFRLACQQGLEGIVAKRKHGPYGEGWFKIRNRRYLQYYGTRISLETRAPRWGALVGDPP